MHRSVYLLQMLLSLFAARGLAPERLDPWRAWVTFKQYVRIVDEVPDPGVSVQVIHHPDQACSLVFLRQALEPDGDWLEPMGGVVCEFRYPSANATGPSWELWSFDSSSFERLVDRVEGNSSFVDLMSKRPTSSSVYWQEA